MITATNILAYPNALLIIDMYTPIPLSPAIHSAITDPTIAYVVDIFIAEKNCGSATGNFAYQYICAQFAPMDFNKFFCSMLTLLNPSANAIAIGKNVVSDTRIIFGASPIPNQMTSKGAIATVGTVWLITKIGLKPKLKILNLSISIANIKPISNPMNRPDKAEINVYPKCLFIIK